MICSHGQAGVCLIDRPGLADEVNLLHRLAYDYAVFVGLDRDDAETFATWATDQRTGAEWVDMGGDFRADLASWTDEVRPV